MSIANLRQKRLSGLAPLFLAAYRKLKQHENHPSIHGYHYYRGQLIMQQQKKATLFTPLSSLDLFNCLFFEPLSLLRSEHSSALRTTSKVPHVLTIPSWISPMLRLSRRGLNWILSCSIQLCLFEELKVTLHVAVFQKLPWSVTHIHNTHIGGSSHMPTSLSQLGGLGSACHLIVAMNLVWISGISWFEVYICCPLTSELTVFGAHQKIRTTDMTGSECVK